MAFIARLHPALIHFPIALVLAAAAAEATAIAVGDKRWTGIAAANVRLGAVFAVIAAIAGWRLASVPGAETTALLEWHRWLGVVAAGMTLIAALATFAATAAAGTGHRLASWTYRTALFAAGALVAAAGHLGGVLVWGVDFLRL